MSIAEKLLSEFELQAPSQGSFLSGFRKTSSRGNRMRIHDRWPAGPPSGSRSRRGDG